jgi:purine-binding chemotaxis protein CheW
MSVEGTSLLFALDAPLYALPLVVVERIVRAVEIAPLPRAPRIVLGVINARGRIIPVVDLRALFRLPARELDIGDRFIIARTPVRTVALVVDRVIGIRELSAGRAESAGNALPFAEFLRGAVQAEGGIVLIYDLDRLLSLDEEAQLDAALEGGAK